MGAAAGIASGDGDEALKAETQRLRARVAELEKSFSPLAGVKTLLSIVARVDGPALSREIEKLLLTGEGGYTVLHDFLHQADIEHEKIDALTHHPQLIFAILRVVALHPDDVARFSSYLMKATRDRPESWLRREMFNFLPVFINHHEGRYPELRRDLESDIVYQIEMGGAFLYKVALAMRDLDFKPPVEIFYPILIDPAKRESHGMVIEHLAARKEEGLQVLRRYLTETRDFKAPTVGAVLQAVIRLEAGKGAGTVEKLLEHEDADLRRSALFAYFNDLRDEAELPRVIKFLNSKEGTIAQKKSFISLVAQKSVGLFDLLFDQAEASITDDGVKESLRRTAAAVAKRKVKKEAAAAKKAARAGQAAAPGPPPE